MMEMIVPRGWKEEFAFVAAQKREDELYDEKMRHVQKRQEERREEIKDAENKKTREEEQEWDMALAATAEVHAFRAHVDLCGVTTVHALMDNEEVRIALTQKIDETLSRAHVLADGPRVFSKRCFGSTVFSLDWVISDRSRGYAASACALVQAHGARSINRR